MGKNKNDAPVRVIGPLRRCPLETQLLVTSDGT